MAIVRAWTLDLAQLTVKSGTIGSKVLILNLVEDNYTITRLDVKNLLNRILNQDGVAHVGDRANVLYGRDLHEVRRFMWISEFDTGVLLEGYHDAAHWLLVDWCQA